MSLASYSKPNAAQTNFNQARSDAEATRRDVNDYIVETLRNLQDQVEKTLNQIQNGIHAVQDEQMRKSISTSPPISEKISK